MVIGRNGLKIVCFRTLTFPLYLVICYEGLKKNYVSARIKQGLKAHRSKQRSIQSMFYGGHTAVSHVFHVTEACSGASIDFQ